MSIEKGVRNYCRYQLKEVFTGLAIRALVMHLQMSLTSHFFGIGICVCERAQCMRAWM